MRLRDQRRQPNGMINNSSSMMRYLVVLTCLAISSQMILFHSYYHVGERGRVDEEKETLRTLPTKHVAPSPLTAATAMPSFPPPQTCAQEQLLAVRHQLPPELCGQQQWLQKCSITIATKCPKATWLDHHYLELQKRHFANGGTTRNMSTTTTQQGASSSSSFLGISVGCNKGFDAINTLRMGTFDESINKVDWKAAMEHDGVQLHTSVCNQDDPKDIFEVVAGSDDHQKRRPYGEMHCIEPMPRTYERLHYSAKALGYMEKGFTVTNAAVSKKSGDMFFPVDGKEGLENFGLATCNNPKVQQERCKLLPVFSLKDFVDQQTQAPKSDPINILTIDVEGFDGDVLLGATSEVLTRVEYLEFEYNWMGSWKDQHLHDIVQMLDGTADMTCYWAGIDRLWRITNCWMAYFDVHVSSNVACVNRRLVPSMASKMEELFEHTLSKTDKQ